MKNPALHQEKRYEPAPVIPLKQDGSLLDWLKENNRIIYREEKEEKEEKIIPSVMPEDDDISDLIEGEEDDFDTDLDEMDVDSIDDDDLI
ncbi:MAG: DUF3134 domain-containing protein [Cyanobacteria bacterium]|nr:DUF3134 domain-containing protein [Cyanobacteria bacterium CG_2015-16_32_12]NCO79142.1 DUF3134 domain-containing protein [Cyanobacteria bacterium CG_2015-22_32_23]NCQ05251.1 DUF3134 domain-containing protein [Cyanobacteria bacterium CG_2015-09_32_10]NCQ40505.1 DUF3134 domain-containing protein [Cyanobacteria bacterium CG_2015-04_32_10]NCS86038.1 DUF3134 domain-containing protein [Cyanobacteria bacterium CG_2015-02_32_10]